MTKMKTIYIPFRGILHDDCYYELEVGLEILTDQVIDNDLMLLDCNELIKNLRDHLISKIEEVKDLKENKAEILEREIKELKSKLHQL